MKLLLDNIIFQLQTIGGISIYWKELLKRIIQNENIDLYCVDANNMILNHAFREIADEIDYDYIKKICPIISNRYFPLFIPKHSSKFIFHSSYYRPLIDIKSKKVVTVHDFMYEKFGHGIRKDIHSLQKKVAIKNADVVVCISNNTKADLLHYFPEFEYKDIRIVYNGVGSAFRLLENRGRKCDYVRQFVGRKYLLVVGNRIGCKNFETTVEAFKRLYSRYDLVVVGSPLSDREKVLLEDAVNRVHVFTNVDDDSLNNLYNAAFALIFPSVYEGFGIPIVEAMKAGCPVVTMKTSSIPEIAMNAGVYMESNSYQEVISCIQKLENEGYRKNIIDFGLVNAKRFSWDNTFNDLLDIYKELDENA